MAGARRIEATEIPDWPCSTDGEPGPPGDVTPRFAPVMPVDTPRGAGITPSIRPIAGLGGRGSDVLGTISNLPWWDDRSPPGAGSPPWLRNFAHDTTLHIPANQQGD